MSYQRSVGDEGIAAHPLLIALPVWISKITPPYWYSHEK
jgi:hypothetical protein